MKKSIIRIVCFVLVLASVLWGTNKILTFKYDDGIYSVTKFYEQEENIVDVLILGSSHAYQSFNTGTLWDQYGMASYALAGSAQPTWNTYYYLKEALKTQSPKLIILEGYMVYYAQEYNEDSYIIKNTYGLKWSWDKVDAIRASVPQDRWNDFIPEYIQYHNRYSSLSNSDFLKNQGNPLYENWKGFLGNMSTKALENPDISNITDREKLYEKTELYYRKTLELAIDNNIPIIVVISPYAGITQQDAACFNTAQDIAEEYGVPLFNGNLFYQDMGIDFATDAADSSHLNYKGSLKFTTFMGKYLKDHYHLPDRRNDPRYQSWQDNADYIRALIKNQELIETYDIITFTEKLQDEHYLYFVSVDGYCTTQNEELAPVFDALKIPPDNTSGLWYADNDGIIWCSGNAPEEQYIKRDGHDIGMKRIYNESNYRYSSIVTVDDSTVSQRKVTNGVNITVYSMVTQSVVDSVGFDADDSYKLVR